MAKLCRTPQSPVPSQIFYQMDSGQTRGCIQKLQDNETPTLSAWWIHTLHFNSSYPRQYGWHFPGDIFKCIFLNENLWISLQILLKFVLEVRINNFSALVQIMAWRRPSDKTLSEPMMVNLLTYICIPLLQWVNSLLPSEAIWHQSLWSSLVQVKAITCMMMLVSC